MSRSLAEQLIMLQVTTEEHQDQSIDQALAFLVNQHQVTQAREFPEPLPIAPPKERQEKSQKPRRVKSNLSPLAKVGIVAENPGTLSAVEFMKAMRHAGRRFTKAGFPFTDRREVRDDQIKAIAAFIGYDPLRDFGAQEREAMAKAQRDLRGPIVGKTREELRAYAKTLIGSVAGLPDPIAKQLANLQARECVSVEAIAAYQTKAADPNERPEERQLASGLAQIEAQRLKQIQKDIDSLLK